jgi:glycine oxidase
VEALLAAASIAGVELFPATPVPKIVIDNGRCTGVCAENGTVFAAREIIVAAGAFSGLLEGIIPRVPTRPIRGQMLALKSQLPVRHVVRCEHCYIVPRDSAVPQRMVTGSTLEDAGFEKRVTAGALEKILSTAQELVPKLSNAEVVELWCGLRPDTPDHLPLLGPAGVAGLTIATGHYRNGILLTPITAKLVREWIVEKHVSMDWEIFNPLRFAETEKVASGDVSASTDEAPGNKPGRKFAHKQS